MTEDHLEWYEGQDPSEYTYALKVLKQNNPDLAPQLEGFSERIHTKFAAVFSDEPQAWIGGEFAETGGVVSARWMRLFCKPNDFWISASLPRNDPEFTGGQTDPQMRMRVNYQVGSPIAIIENNAPPYDRDGELQRTLLQVTDAVGVDRIAYDTRAGRGGPYPGLALALGRG